MSVQRQSSSDERTSATRREGKQSPDLGGGSLVSPKGKTEGKEEGQGGARKLVIHLAKRKA